MNEAPSKTPLSSVINELFERLPREPGGIWSPDGEEILCDTSQRAEVIADLIDTLYGGQAATTGYYDDPENDESRFDYYYVRIE